MSEELTKAAEQFHADLYGPKMCNHCGKVQPIITYELEGSRSDSFDGQTFKRSFIGNYVCSVCRRTIEPSPSVKETK